MMRLYLVRHGDAEAKMVGQARLLTEKGRDDVARVAALAQGGGVKVDRVYHSGKRRAEETAAILANHLEPATGVACMPGIRPGDDVGPTAEVLACETASLMLVGHSPHLDRLAGLLLAGDEGRSVVDFQTGSMVCLEQHRWTGTWSIRWMITPDIVCAV
jgi:phosphohistidine phosphatase